MSQQPSRHYGNYRGEVVRNDDPLKAGRVKVSVFGLFDDIPEDGLPWAIYADPLMGGIANVGSIVVPEIGAHVWCFFEGGDHHYPVYWAGAPAMKDGTPDIPEESAAGYPANKVRKTKSGILMEMDDSKDNVRLRFYHPSDTEWLIDNDGNQIDNVSANKTTNISENETSTIGADKTTDVTGSETTTIGADKTTDVTGNDTRTIAGNEDKTVTGNSTHMATNVTITASGAVMITSSAAVNIVGTMITLN